MQIVYPDEGAFIKPLNSLEDFLDKIRSHLLEKVIYAKAQAASLVFHSEEVPPVIAPVLRASTVVNTEHLKNSVYLKKKKEATGRLLTCSTTIFDNTIIAENAKCMYNPSYS